MPPQGIPNPPFEEFLACGRLQTNQANLARAQEVVGCSAILTTDNASFYTWTITLDQPISALLVDILCQASAAVSNNYHVEISNLINNTFILSFALNATGAPIVNGNGGCWFRVSRRHS